VREVACSRCGNKTALGTMFASGQEMLCATCAPQVSPQLPRLLDPTICAQCQADNGSSAFESVSGWPYCQACRELIYNRPFPQWLKISFAGLLVLLMYSLSHGQQYFVAGRSLYAAEKLIAARHMPEAALMLEPVLLVAPDCEKCILLYAKAKLLAGDYSPAFAALQKHDNGNFKTNDLSNEVVALTERVNRAFTKAKEARALSEQDDSTAAAKLVREARGIYPETSWEALTAYIDGGAAFDKQDYDGYVANARTLLARQPGNSGSAANLASALACKYAVSNDPAFKAEAEAMLAKARELAQDAEEQKNLDEFQERFQHRLRTRLIINRAEYNRRFHPELVKKSAAKEPAKP